MDGIDRVAARPISPTSPPPVAAVGATELCDGRALEPVVVAPTAVVTADRLVFAVAVVDPDVRALGACDLGIVDNGVVAALVGAPVALGPGETEKVPGLAAPLLAAVLAGPALGDDVQDASTAISTIPANVVVDDDDRLILFATPVVLVVATRKSQLGACTCPVIELIRKYAERVPIVGRGSHAHTGLT